MRNMNMIDLNLLRVFDALMRERNVSLAAQRLNVTQPAVSNALNRLRESFDDKLFVRTRNSMEPTATAIAAYDQISQGLASIQMALTNSVQFEPLASRRRFTIITTDVGELTYISQLLRILRDEAPHLDVSVLEASREEYEKMLDSGLADFAVGRFKIRDSFRCEVIGSCVYVAVLCSRHARRLQLTTGGVMPYETFVNAAHVDVIPRGATENPIGPALGADNARRRVALTLPHTAVLPAILPDTQLVATVPQPAVTSLCSNGTLAWAYLPFETEVTQVFMGWHKRQDGDRGHIWMREKLRSIHFDRLRETEMVA